MVVWEDGSEAEYMTDENGEVVIELAGLLPDDVTPVEAHVRDQSGTMFVQDDEHHGVQEIEFTVTDGATADAEALEVDSVKRRGFEPFTESLSAVASVVAPTSLLPLIDSVRSLLERDFAVRHLDAA